MGEEILKYYSRKDIQKALVEAAKDREVAVQFSDKGFGKRPDILQYENDVLELAKQGATSFHASEERWSNPLQLKAGMTKQQLDSLRVAWDLLIDIDCKFLEYSKITANLLIDALRFHEIKNIGIKFSGNRSFHLAIPFESFPNKVNEIETRLLFPEGVRVIASYLKDLIKIPLANKILEVSNIKEISQSLNKKIKEETFNPYDLIEIDTVLISNRHMFRMPYSVNEKTGLVSLPIKFISEFELSRAKPENVKVDITFLDTSKIKEPEATRLIMQAFDWQKKTPESKISKRSFKIPENAISEEFFPPCIKLVLKGLKQDGRKRAIFILTNFLKNLGYKLDEIQDMLLKWNKNNYEILKENYIISQINWHKKQGQNILPPNCDNPMYYKSLDICQPDNLCKLIKNPVNYTIRKRNIKYGNKNYSRKYKSKSKSEQY